MELDDRARRALAGANFAAIATSMPDGAPHVSTVWIDADGDDVLVNTAEGRVKTENVRRDPRVSISLIDREDPYEQVVIHGTVVDVSTDGADGHIDRLAKKYLGVDAYPWRDAQEQRVILRIRPDRVSSG
ncbi:MAG TPA: PPOX class F420-dependent oxidoreductase [Actinomycetota bacterium]